eukprot:Tamp_21649.p1 GENE.Tamp_21649~~Tamp_21649.p1  ORF type:complete len:323 (-),score=45.54 Tamp_21649:164-1132(-)
MCCLARRLLDRLGGGGGLKRSLEEGNENAPAKRAHQGGNALYIATPTPIQSSAEACSMPTRPSLTAKAEKASRVDVAMGGMPPGGQRRKPCNCRKSKCLKLYCECFAAGVYCEGGCNCRACHNNPRFEMDIKQEKDMVADFQRLRAEAVRQKETQQVQCTHGAKKPHDCLKGECREINRCKRGDNTHTALRSQCLKGECREINRCKRGDNTHTALRSQCLKGECRERNRCKRGDNTHTALPSQCAKGECGERKRQRERERIAKRIGFASFSSYEKSYDENWSLMRERGVGALSKVYHVNSMQELSRVLDEIIAQDATQVATP